MTGEETGATQVFIVRIWVEPCESGHDRVPEWRGSIEHVPGGERRYFHNLRAIRAFIVPYLEAAGLDVSKLGELRRWLQRRRRW